MNNHIKKLAYPICFRYKVYRQKRWLHKQIHSVMEPKIVIGASGRGQSEWITTEQYLLDLLNPQTWEEFFRENSIHTILAEHVWEHLTLEQGLLAAQTCFRFIRQNGYLRVAVPDGYHPDPAYIDAVRVGGSGYGADDHKVLYNYETFRDLFEAAGFHTELLEYFDEDKQFHMVEWAEEDGLIRRSSRFDARNKVKSYAYTSLILDAKKI